MLYTILSFNNPRESKYIIFSLKKFIIRNAAHNVLKLLCAFIKKPITYNHNLLYKFILIISNQNYFKLNTNEDILVMMSCKTLYFFEIQKINLNLTQTVKTRKTSLFFATISHRNRVY